jgi:hypothetical protein
MGPGEIVARTRRTIEHRADDALLRIAPRAWRKRWKPPLDSDVMWDAIGPAGLFTAERAVGLAQVAPGERERVIARADRFLDGEVQFFGYPSVRLALPIDYRFDPHAGLRWPDRHGKQIDYRHMPGGDAKWIWELNRCQELPVLVQAWLLTGEERYALAARDEALRWAEQNPPGRGVAWVNGYEAGLRVISLSMTFAALRHAGVPMSRDQRAGFLSLLWQHGRWIQRDPSTHSSANNHRIGELVGLVVLSTLIPELEDTRRWLHDGLNELAGEASRQILGDGMGAEQAFTYQLYVLDLLLVAIATLDTTGNEVPRPLLDAIARSGDALWAQIGSEEPALTYGDTDDGVALRLSAAELRDARSLAAAVAARVSHPRARAVAQCYDAAAWWLFGADGHTRFEQTEPAADPGDVHLAEGGLVMLRRGHSRVTMDVGSLGYLSLAAHGHADALALTLTTRGADIVADPGTGSYFRSHEVREAFRGTGFHATVEVDGTSQSEPGGAFLWAKHAKVEEVKVDLERGTISASHDGYMRLEDPVRHRRHVTATTEEALLVVDRLEAAKDHRYRQLWPFHRDVDVEVEGDMCVTAAIDGRSALRVHFASTAAGHLDVVRGHAQPLAGWWSDRLESWEPAWLASWTVSSSGIVYIAALLTYDGAPEQNPQLGIRLEGDLAVVTLDGEQIQVGLDLGQIQSGRDGGRVQVGLDG